MLIKGIYQIPEIRRVIFIVSTLEEFSSRLKIPKENLSFNRLFIRIIKSHDSKAKIKGRYAWTKDIMTEKQFSFFLKKQLLAEKFNFNQTFNSECDVDISSLNLGCPFRGKEFSEIDEKDMIEVFI